MSEVFGVNISKGISYQIFKQLLKLLPSEKQDKLNRYTSYKDAQRGLVAELLIRYILRAKGCSNDEIYFQRTPFGKPFLPKLADVNFNLSHSQDWVVCAIDKNPIGIDVEYIQPIDLNIANQFFTKKECNYIFSSFQFQLVRFYEIWTMKESYLKAIGSGLSIPLDSFSIVRINNEFMVDTMKEKYSLKLIEINTSYKLSVCGSNSKLPFDVNIVMLDIIISTML